MNLPTGEYRRTEFLRPEDLHLGLDGVLYGLQGWLRRTGFSKRRELEVAGRICDSADSLRGLSDKRLRSSLREMQRRFRRWGSVPPDREAVFEALAAIVEAADRTTGLRPFPVQVTGAIALNDGYLAEMATGEGKSLTACLTAVLAAWTGRPCHIITVNDYLAGRDAAEMRTLYAYCGVSTGCVTSQMAPEQRRENYANGVVYTTSKEIVADFLRDRLLLGKYQDPSRRLLRKMLLPRWQQADDLVMRGLFAAIVDEADSVLIDEAVTPLIISRATENQPMTELYQAAFEVAGRLLPGLHYKKEIKYKEIELTQRGRDTVDASAPDLPGIWRGEDRRIELVKQALTAREFYIRDRQYVVQDGKVTIVDEFTGRLMPNRTWRQGLHQAVEAKEGLAVTSPSETLARLSFQRFFRFFSRLSGMTGTAASASAEFWHIYGLPVVSIPTNRPCVRRMISDRVFPNKEKKLRAVVDEIARLRQEGRPVLVGTRSVEASEQLGQLLAGEGLSFNLLNAVRHAEEARIVAAAGEAGRITIATNMAGRGTDIKLGRGVAGKGGLHVIATERHESARIDRQLFGRCARQGDPGSAQAFISLEDELIQRFVPAAMGKRLSAAVAKNLPGASMLAESAVGLAQRAAEQLAYRQRRSVLQMDDWLEEALSFAGATGIG